jgi:O-antigen ligase
MENMFNNLSLEKIYQYLLISLAFLMPISVFGANLIIVIIVVLWLLSGSYKHKIKQIISSKFLLASIFFYCLHIIGMLWTNDLYWGLEILHKMWYFILLLPVLFTIVIKKNIKYYIIAFLAAIALTELISYLIWFELMTPFKVQFRLEPEIALRVIQTEEISMKLLANPTPFMTHVSYNPILAFAIYLVLHEIFLNKKLDRVKFFLYSFFAITMTFNMFITGGRAGQVMFFVMLTILIFQFFNSEKVKSLIAIFILIPGVFYAAYQSSDLFQKRVDLAFHQIVTYETNHNSSIGKRINYALNSWEIIYANPILGVGTGDFPSEFQKVSVANNNQEHSITRNPHNMYHLILIQLGFVGLVSFLSIFYYQIKFSLSSSTEFLRDTGITLPLLYLVIMFSDSYLLGHFTSLLYVFFSSFLYKDFEKN